MAGCVSSGPQPYRDLSDHASLRTKARPFGGSRDTTVERLKRKA
jgi:hypothetical protein